MLCIDERSNTARLLSLGNSVNSKGCLTTRLGTIYLDDTSFGNTAHTKRQVEGDRACGNCFNIESRAFAKLHNGALTEGLFDLTDGKLQCLFFFVISLCHNKNVLSASNFKNGKGYNFTAYIIPKKPPKSNRFTPYRSKII